MTIHSLDVYATDESSDLIDQGLVDLGGQHYERALKNFKAAEQANPQDHEAVFFQGVTFNRMNRFEEGCSQLQKATSMGSTHPDLAFEKGWCLLGTEHYAKAATELEAHERANPQNGKTREFLGRAYYHLGKYDLAIQKLEEAITQEPNLERTARFYLALTEKTRKNEKAATKHFSALRSATKENSQLTGLLGPLFGLKTAPQKKPWQVTILASGGFNDNVIGLSDQASLPANVSGKDSPFVRLTLNAKYDWLITPRDTLTAGYTFYSDTYSELPNFNLLDHFASLSATHRWSNKFSGTLLMSNEFTQLDGEDFRNQIGGRPSVIYRFAPWAATELSYYFKVSDYFRSTPPPQDRTGTSHAGGLTQYLNIPDTKIWLHAGYFFTKNFTDGSDFDARTHGILGGLSTPLFWDLELNASYRKTFDRYKNVNSFTLLTSPIKRKDDIESITAQLSRSINLTFDQPIYENLKVFARYDRFKTDSNIGVFSFVQNVWSGGVTMTF